MEITKYTDEHGTDHPIKDENALHKSDLAQGLGTDENKTMSQKAITEALRTAGGGSGGGFSPIVELSKTGKVTTLKITDANGTKTAEINDGADGAAGAAGANGKDGKSAYAYARDSGYTGTESEFAAALARIAAMPIYDGSTEGVDTITFIIQISNDKEYTAISDMTWGDWVNSAYNTDGFFVNASDIVCESGGAAVQLSGADIKSTDTIIADTHYSYAGG